MDIVDTLFEWEARAMSKVAVLVGSMRKGGNTD